MKMRAVPRPPPAGKIVPIDRPAQWRALASPLRQEIFDVLEAAGPCSIAELAERLARAPDSLYFHVRRLRRAGLVVERERRREGRHVFVVVDVAARPMRIDRTKVRDRDLAAVVGGLLRLSSRDFRRGLSQSSSVASGPLRNHAAARVRGWVDGARLERVNALLEELGQLLRTGRPGPATEPVALAWVLAPVPGRRVPAARAAKGASVERLSPGVRKPKSNPRGVRR